MHKEMKCVVSDGIHTVVLKYFAEKKVRFYWQNVYENRFGGAAAV